MTGGSLASLAMAMSPADIWVAVSGLLALSFTQFGGARLKLAAPFIGLAGQPAWAWIAMQGDHPGMLVITAAYAVIWAGGCVRSIRLLTQQGGRHAGV